MKMNRVLKGIMFAGFALIACVVFGLVVMALWNWLMPGLFGLRVITYWQALGLLVLSRILLGGFRGHGGARGRWRHRMRERWERMTPEEREKFSEGMRRGCGPIGSPPAEPKA